MTASTQALIDEFAARSSPFPLPPTRPANDQVSLGHRAAMIRMRDDIPKEDMPPWRRFVFTTPSPRCDVAESSAVAAARASRSATPGIKSIWNSTCRAGGIPGKSSGKTSEKSLTIGT
nr:hypothetical protein [Tanacetum cinerariifolium]